MLGLSSLQQLCWAGEKGEEQGAFVTKSPLGTRKFQFVALFGLIYGIAISKIEIQVCSNHIYFFFKFLKAFFSVLIMGFVAQEWRFGIKSNYQRLGLKFGEITVIVYSSFNDQ